MSLWSVCRVEESQNPDYQLGDWVVSFAGWQDYTIANGEGLLKLDASLTHHSYALGVLGMPGLTAYMGLLEGKNFGKLDVRVGPDNLV